MNLEELAMERESIEWVSVELAKLRVLEEITSLESW